jgi:hypothetical protein
MVATQSVPWAPTFVLVGTASLRPQRLAHELTVLEKGLKEAER